jgi:hypothetical protein
MQVQKLRRAFSSKGMDGVMVGCAERGHLHTRTCNCSPGCLQGIVLHFAQT